MPKWPWKKPKPAVEVVYDPPAERDPEPIHPNDQTEGVWVGAVAFREGWYHPIIVDENWLEVGPDPNRKLVHVDGEYVFATGTEPNHFHRYGLREAVLEIEA